MTDQHQPFDDDPNLYEDPREEREGGTTHGQDEADDRARLLDDKGTGTANPANPRTDSSAEDTQPADEDL